MKMDFRVVVAIVVPFSILGALVLSFNPGVDRLGKRPERTSTLLLSIVAYCSLTALLLSSTDDFNPWWIIPPYIGIPVCTLFWCIQWKRKWGLGRMASMSVTISAISLWVTLVYSQNLVWRQWMLFLTIIIYVHAFFYEFWIEGHRSYFKQ